LESARYINEYSLGSSECSDGGQARLTGATITGQHHEQLSSRGILHSTEHILDFRVTNSLSLDVTLKGVAVRP
jgi:hypothetical protein